MQILILGMHRSGTSATTRLVNMMGAWFGPEGGQESPTIDNPKGFWERSEVFKLNEAILASKGCSWSRLKRWSFDTAHQAPSPMAKRIRHIVQKMDGQRPWVLKDPRLCLLLPAWRPHLQTPVAVVVYRNPAEIAASLHRRDGFAIEYGLALWEYYAVGLLNASLDMPRLFVRHADIIQNPVAACRHLAAELQKHGVRGIDTPSDREILAFIDPALYRSRPPAQPALSDAQRTLSDMLQGGVRQTGPLFPSAHARTVIEIGKSA